MSSPGTAAAKTGITLKANLSRVLAQRKHRKIKPSELEPKIATWKIVRGDTAPTPASCERWAGLFQRALVE